MDKLLCYMNSRCESDYPEVWGYGVRDYCDPCWGGSLCGKCKCTIDQVKTNKLVRELLFFVGGKRN